MQRLLGLASALALVALSTVLGAQSPTPSVTSSVSAPAAVACSAEFSSSLTLTGYDVQDPGVADILLVLDESGSINLTAFNQMKQFAGQLAQGLMADASGARVGLAMFSGVGSSGSARTVFNLSDNTSLVQSGISALTQQGGWTCIGCGIEQGRTIIASSPPRPEATQFMIVLTDGQNNRSSVPNQTPTANLTTIVNDAKAAGIKMLAIGVGNNVDPSQIEFIASDIDGVQTAFLAADFASLTGIIGQLTAAIVSPGSTNVSVVVSDMPRFPITGASASAGDVAVAGGQVVWTLPSLGAASQTLTIDHQHDGTGNGPLQVFSATYSDTQAHLVDIDVPSTVVSGCNVAPVANAGSDQTVAVVGATASVTLDGSGSTDDGLIQPLAYAWSSDTGVVASGVSPTVTLPVGTHTFTLVVDDGEYTDVDTVVITVIDTTPPEIDSVSPSTGMLWPPNHRMVPVSLAVVATDNVDAAPMCSITGVTSSEAGNGRGDGNTTGDAVITGPLTVELRSERAGRGNGRTYTIEVTCTDAAGNASTGTTTVSAPKSQGRGR